jgi:hypothetical protein
LDLEVRREVRKKSENLEVLSIWVAFQAMENVQKGKKAYDGSPIQLSLRTQQ